MLSRTEARCAQVLLSALLDPAGVPVEGAEGLRVRYAASVLADRSARVLGTGVSAVDVVAQWPRPAGRRPWWRRPAARRRLPEPRRRDTGEHR